MRVDTTRALRLRWRPTGWRRTTDDVDLEGKTYFFWKSGSSFEQALSLNPWIKSMTHFCGPGNTQRILEKNGVQPHVFLDHAQWLKEMSE